MEACSTCKIRVRTEEQYCPLCGTQLEKCEDDGGTRVVNHYPDLSRQLAQYHLVRHIFQFFTIFGCLFSVLANFLLTPDFWWSVIVLAGAAYCWILIPALLRKGINFARQIVFQVLLTCAVVILIDAITGYRGWSVSFVVPGVLSAGIVATWLMAMFNRTRWNQYVFYQALVCVFGFIPLILYLLGVAESLMMVLITVGLAMASLIFTFLFGDRNIKNEFVKRFHI